MSLVPNILVVTPSLQVGTMADVIAYAKAAPDGIDMASSGNGTLQHLSLEMFRFMTGAKVNHVPYRGGGPALNDVMGGQVKLFFSNGSSVVGIIQGGKVRAIAHTGKGRLKSLPDIPPVSDTLPGFEAYEWNGVFVPHGTPPAIVRTLNERHQRSDPARLTSGNDSSNSTSRAGRARRKNSARSSGIRWRDGARW